MWVFTRSFWVEVRIHDVKTIAFFQQKQYLYLKFLTIFTFLIFLVFHYNFKKFFSASENSMSKISPKCNKNGSWNGFLLRAFFQNSNEFFSSINFSSVYEYKSVFVLFLGSNLVENVSQIVYWSNCNVIIMQFQL